MRHAYILMSLGSLFMLVAPLALAQGDVDNVPKQEESFVNQPEGSGALEDERQIFQQDMRSLLFSHWEHVEIEEARSRIGQIIIEPVVEPEPEVTDVEPVESAAEVAPEEELEAEPVVVPELPKVKPPPYERDISLGGLIYTSPDDWTIWLNGVRLTPGDLPPEVSELRVYDGYIELKWFDQYTDKVIPIRLRPYQRFNIDTRIFLPG